MNGSKKISWKVIVVKESHELKFQWMATGKIYLKNEIVNIKQVNDGRIKDWKKWEVKIGE